MEPYLKANRLQDIIAAIQVMGTYPKYSSREHEKWISKLGEAESGDDWYQVCKEHPEFFRTNEKQEDGVTKRWVGLRWRWSMLKNYSPSEDKVYTLAEIEKLKEPEKSRLTKAPMESAQLEALINSAIQLHTRAIEQAKEKRWWVPVVIPAITALTGACLGFAAALLKSQS